VSFLVVLRAAREGIEEERELLEAHWEYLRSLHADGKLVGEVSVRRIGASAECQPRKLAQLQAALEPSHEVAALVELGA